MSSSCCVETAINLDDYEEPRPHSATTLNICGLSQGLKDIMSGEGEAPSKVAIGITFGNSYSSIASTVTGDAVVIANEEGDRQIPSFLSYVEGEEFHGAQAKAQAVRNPSNTVAYFRDFLGKK